MIQALTSQATKFALDRLGQMSNNAGLGGTALPTDSANASFDQILSEISGGVTTNLQKAESLSVQKMSGGDVSVREVVNSVMEAERSLNTAIAIRDKIVQAYLEVSRMQI